MQPKTDAPTAAQPRTAALRPRLLPMRDAPRYAGLSRSALYRATRDGTLRIVKNGRSALLVVAELDALVDAMIAASPPRPAPVAPVLFPDA